MLPPSTTFTLFAIISSLLISRSAQVNSKLKATLPSRVEADLEEELSDSDPDLNLPDKPEDFDQGTKYDPFNVRLLHVKWCRSDILKLCMPNVLQDNFGILKCLQRDQATVDLIAPECKTFLWHYKSALSNSDKFYNATLSFCGQDIYNKLNCPDIDPDLNTNAPSLKLSCMMWHEEKLKEYGAQEACIRFMHNLKLAIFADYWVVKSFTEACNDLILETNCGGIAPPEPQHPEGQPAQKSGSSKDHSQMATLNCLFKEISKPVSQRIPAAKKVPSECRKEMTRLLELQADDIHMNQPLLFACSADRNQFCPNVKAGQGRVYKCLIEHRMDTTKVCQEKLQEFVNFAQQDVKIFRAFYLACQNELTKADCSSEKYAPLARSKNDEEENQDGDQESDQAPKGAHGQILQLSSALICLNELSQRRQRGGLRMGEACSSMVRTVRKILFEDMDLNPRLVHSCSHEINACTTKDGHIPFEVIKDNDPRRTSSEILHCLMKTGRDALKHVDQRTSISDSCLRELRIFMREVSPAEDMQLDPYMSEHCAPVLEKECADFQLAADDEDDLESAQADNVSKEDEEEDDDDDGEGDRNAVERQRERNERKTHKSESRRDSEWAFHCLLERLDSPAMQQSPQCAERVREIAFFVSRDFRLDPHLFRACSEHASTYCNVELANATEFLTGQGGMDSGDFILPCLYGHVKSGVIRGACSDEVLRVMRERSQSVDLNPEIEHACLKELGDLCSNKDIADKGKELECLVQNRKSLDEKGECKQKIDAYITQLENDVALDRLLYDYCKPLIKGTCRKQARAFKGNSREGGELLECLIENKLTKASTSQCQHMIEHYQILAYEDVRFSPRFLALCSDDMSTHCPTVPRQNKAAMLECLSKEITNEALGGAVNAGGQIKDKDKGKNKSRKLEDDDDEEEEKEDEKSEELPSVSSACRVQLRLEFLHMLENVKLDPAISSNCEKDLREQCNTLAENHPERLECLKQHFEQLEPQCRNAVFRRGMLEAFDDSLDQVLHHRCSGMIDQFCTGKPNEPQPAIVPCLQKNLADPEFEEDCAVVVRTRTVMQAFDFRLQPELVKSCTNDILDQCRNVIKKHSQSSLLARKQLAAAPSIVGKELGKFQMFEGKVISCLREHYTNDTLSATCMSELKQMTRSAAFKFHIDPMLRRACKDQIETKCSRELENPRFLGALGSAGVASIGDLREDTHQLLRGVQAIEECLKNLIKTEEIDEERGNGAECANEVRKIIGEETADLNVDTLLYQACRADLRAFCPAVPEGRGKQAACLLHQLKLEQEGKVPLTPASSGSKKKSQKEKSDAKNSDVEEDRRLVISGPCRTMLEGRIDLWSASRGVPGVPVESLTDLFSTIQDSPSSNYLLIVLFSVAILICAMGCLCGRKTSQFNYLKLSTKRV